MNDKPNRWDPAHRPPAHLPNPSLSLEASRSVPSPINESSTISNSSSLVFPTKDLSEYMELNAIIGAGTAFDGTLSFSGRIRIDGEFSGRALGGELLVIGEGARVIGELRAQKIVVLGGKVDAEIRATESIELYIPAVVSGDLRSPQIYLDRGIEFQGTCDMSDGPLSEANAASE